MNEIESKALSLDTLNALQAQVNALNQRLGIFAKFAQDVAEVSGAPKDAKLEDVSRKITADLAELERFRAREIKKSNPVSGED